MSDVEYQRTQARIHAHRRRLRQRDGATLTLEEWETIKFCFNYQCARCGDSRKLEMDHIIPLSKGGKHAADNIQPLCGPCNRRKGAGTIVFH